MNPHVIIAILIVAVVGILAFLTIHFHIAQLVEDKAKALWEKADAEFKALQLKIENDALKAEIFLHLKKATPAPLPSKALTPAQVAAYARLAVAEAALSAPLPAGVEGTVLQASRTAELAAAQAAVTSANAAAATAS